MSAERKEFSQTSSTFPIKKLDSEKAIEWGNAYLRNPGGVNASLQQLLAKHEHLYAFLVDMDSLRTLLSNRKPHNISYFDGSLVMLQAIENSYFRGGKVLPVIKEGICEGYFNNLLDIENNHHEFEEIKKDLYIPPEQDLKPNDLYFTVTNGLSDPKKVTRVVSALHSGSRGKIREFRQKEKIFFEAAIGNRAGILPRSYQHGILDVYGAFEQIELSERIEELVREPVISIPASFEDGWEL